MIAVSRYLKMPQTELGHADLMDLVKRSKPNRGAFHFWKTIFTKGYVEMPSKEHFE